MSDLAPRGLLQRLDPHRKTVVAATAIVAVLGATVGLRAVTRTDGEGSARTGSSEQRVAAGAEGLSQPVAPSQDGGPATTSSVSGASSPGSGSGSGSRSVSARKTTSVAGGAAPSTGSASGSAAGAPAGSTTPLPGVTDEEITVAYYWKGDRTR